MFIVHETECLVGVLADCHPWWGFLTDMSTVFPIALLSNMQPVTLLSDNLERVVQLMLIFVGTSMLLRLTFVLGLFFGSAARSILSALLAASVYRKIESMCLLVGVFTAATVGVRVGVNEYHCRGYKSIPQALELLPHTKDFPTHRLSSCSYSLSS